MPLPEKKPLYLHLETDDEFLERIHKTFKWWNAWGKGSDALDEEAWHELKMQRKLVERG